MVYLFTYHRVPDGDASSTRFVAHAKIFKSCGYDVMLVGMGESEYLKVCEFEGIKYLSLRVKSKSIFGKLKNYFGFKSRIKNFLNNKNDIKAIVISQLPINALSFMKQFSKKNKLPIFVDCCEWHSSEQFKLGKINPEYVLKEYFVRRFIDNNTYPISITKYLTSYFSKKGINAVNIPVVLDVFNTGCNKKSNQDKLILMYAGSIGRKDYLDVIFSGLSQLDKTDLSKIEFRIFGAKLSEIEIYLQSDIFNKISSSIKCYGKVDRKTVLDNLEEADFTVLMRSSRQRYAKAGFPTKVVESLASATPVICNLTSDLKHYIIDGYNGLVVDGDTSEDFCKAVQKAICLTAEEKSFMQKNARETAEKSFDYRQYTNRIDRVMKFSDFDNLKKIS